MPRIFLMIKTEYSSNANRTQTGFEPNLPLFSICQLNHKSNQLLQNNDEPNQKPIKIPNNRVRFNELSNYLQNQIKYNLLYICPRESLKIIVFCNLTMERRSGIIRMLYINRYKEERPSKMQKNLIEIICVWYI